MGRTFSPHHPAWGPTDHVHKHEDLRVWFWAPRQRGYRKSRFVGPFCLCGGLGPKCHDVVRSCNKQPSRNKQPNYLCKPARARRLSCAAAAAAEAAEAALLAASWQQWLWTHPGCPNHSSQPQNKELSGVCHRRAIYRAYKEVAKASVNAPIANSPPAMALDRRTGPSPADWDYEGWSGRRPCTMMDP